MPDTQIKKPNRVQARLPNTLMLHVEARTGDDGLFADSSDYLRHLIREDMLREEPSLYEYAMEAAQAPDSAYEELSADDIISYSKQKYGN